jgi:hypothetical protein
MRFDAFGFAYGSPLAQNLVSVRAAVRDLLQRNVGELEKNSAQGVVRSVELRFQSVQLVSERTRARENVIGRLPSTLAPRDLSAQCVAGSLALLDSLQRGAALSLQCHGVINKGEQCFLLIAPPYRVAKDIRLLAN